MKLIQLSHVLLRGMNTETEANDASQETSMTNLCSVLMILTSHTQLGSSEHKTGFWLEELATPYLEFQRAGCRVELTSPAGGPAAADPKSEQDTSENVRAFLADAKAMAKLRSTQKLADVKAPYDAYFVVGGHGVMWDLPKDTKLAKLLATAYEAGRLVAAVCHGPAALVNLKLSNGEYLVKGRRVSAFTNEEEAAVGLTKVVPFALESELRERGALFQPAPMWSSFVVRDKNLITGQNPASSGAVARATLSALEEKR